jgi:hypothetical protein
VVFFNYSWEPTIPALCPLRALMHLYITYYYTKRGRGGELFLDGIRFLTDAGVYNSEKPTKKIRNRLID